MLRISALALLLLPCLLSAQDKGAQDKAKLMNSRTKVLDVAATTPVFTKRGADAVKRVIAGGDAHKADEKVLQPLDAQPGAAGPGMGAPGSQPSLQLPGPGQGAQQAPPPPDPKFEWRLMGISYGKQDGLALFQAGSKSMSVGKGAVLDSETKIVSVSKSMVVLVFHGKRLELMPW